LFSCIKSYHRVIKMSRMLFSAWRAVAKSVIARASDLPLRSGDRFGAKGAPRDDKVQLAELVKR
jgi:hypothetical protein